MMKMNDGCLQSMTHLEFVSPCVIEHPALVGQLSFLPDEIFHTNLSYQLSHKPYFISLNCLQEASTSSFVVESYVCVFRMVFLLLQLNHTLTWNLRFYLTR